MDNEDQDLVTRHSFSKRVRRAVLQRLVDLGVTREFVEATMLTFVQQSEARIEQRIKERVNSLVENYITSRWSRDSMWLSNVIQKAFVEAARSLITERFVSNLNVTVTFNDASKNT